MSSDSGTPQAGANAAGFGTNEESIRAGIAQLLGSSLYDDREYYDLFDWPSIGGIDTREYYGLYLRNPFAKTVVERPAFTAWRDTPTVVARAEDGSRIEESPLANAIERADRELGLWSYAERLDKVAGIGRYGVAVFITDDISRETFQEDLRSPFDPTDTDATGLDTVNQIKVFSEASVESIEYGDVEAAAEGRWGKPTALRIDFSPEVNIENDTDDGFTYEVHHSRFVTTPASRLNGNDVFGRPRLEPVYNVLKDMEKTMGAVAEMAFRGAEKGLAVSYDPEKLQFEGSPEWMEQENEQYQEWHHGLQWFLQTVGDIEQLGGDIAPLSNIFEPHLTALATGTKIPKRVFEGSPLGALSAAGEDTQAYFGMISERRTEYDEPHIARPFVEWFRQNDLVPFEAAYYDFEWPALRVLSKAEKADVASQLAQYLPAAYTVGEFREMVGDSPTPDAGEIDAEQTLHDAQSGGGGMGMGPATNAGRSLEATLREAREHARKAGRAEARMERGRSEADE